MTTTRPYRKALRADRGTEAPGRRRREPARRVAGQDLHRRHRDGTRCAPPRPGRARRAALDPADSHRPPTGVTAGSRPIRFVRPAPPPPPARIDLPRVVSAVVVLALAGSCRRACCHLRRHARTGRCRGRRRRWSVRSAAVQVTATNIGDDGGGEAVGCVEIADPERRIHGHERRGRRRQRRRQLERLRAPSGSDDHDRSHPVGLRRREPASRRSAGVGRAPRSASTTGQRGTYSWVGNAYNKEDCTDNFLMPRTVLVTVDGAAPERASRSASPDLFTAAKNVTLTEPATGRARRTTSTPTATR